MSNETTNPVLKWILIIVACVSIPVAIILALYPAKEYRAARELRARGFDVQFTWLDNTIWQRPVAVKSEGRNITLDDCRLICQLPHLKALFFMEGDMCDMSDMNLDEIGNCTELEHFICENVTQFPAGEIRQLTACPLKTVRLLNVDLHDSDLENLAGMATLDLIYLDNNVGITDAGLEHIEKIVPLMMLSLKGTNITQEGVEEFQKKRPDVKVRF